MTLEKQFHNALHYLKRNYPNGVTTWGKCCNDYCDKPARGSGYCADCAEAMIAEIINDKDIARGIHDAIKKASILIGSALFKVESQRQRKRTSE
jgi:hypothetical protein